MIVRMFIVLLLPVMLGFSYAQGNPLGLDFEQALQMAFSNDPGLEARNDAVNAEKLKVRQAISTFYPKLNAYSSYTRTSLESGIGIFNPVTMSRERIDFFPKDRYNFGVLLSHEIYTFGRRMALKKGAEKGVGLSEMEREEYRQSVFERTARAFAITLLSRDNMNIQAENIKRAQTKLNIVLERINEGLATDYDRIKAELLLAQYKHNHNLARGEFRKARANLKALIGWDRKYDFIPTGSLLGLNIAIPESFDLKPDNRIEIRRLKLQSEALGEKITINRSEYFPGLGFMAKYDWQNGYQPDIDDIKGAWSIGVSLNWRLIDGGDRKSRISQARLDVSRINNLKADMEICIRSEMETAVAEMETATEEMSLARKKLKLADEGLEIAEAQYRQGLLGISDLLDLEIDRARAEKDLNYATYNLAIARIDLKKAVGYYPELR